MGNVAHPNPLKMPVPKPGYNEFLKKNVPPSQIYRLQKRAAARAEQAQNSAELANTELKRAAEKAQKDAEKARTETLKHKKVAEKAIKDLEEVNVKAEQIKAQAEQAKTKLERLKVIIIISV